MQATRRYTHGSLFAGIGGFDLGFERAGFETIWQVEIDPFCRKVLEKHWPNVRRYRDVRKVSGVQRPDVISGGFPCQDVSRAGFQAGIGGERSRLWVEYARLICELRPSFAVVENVPGLLDGGIGRVLGDLAEIGYDAEWDSLPAAAFGAPHIRDRIWLLAYPAKCERFNGDSQRLRTHVLPDADGRREATERCEDWKILELVPGVRKRMAADWWLSQSRVERSADGLPDQLDRLRVLGNAVVPQIAEWIAQRIKQVMDAEKVQVGRGGLSS